MAFFSAALVIASLVTYAGSISVGAYGKLLGGDLYNYIATGMTPINSEYSGYFPGSLQTLFGSTLKYLAFLMGVPWENANEVGNLLGIKFGQYAFDFGYTAGEQGHPRANTMFFSINMKL